ncbi:MAG: tRNA (adenosine(37)-N6)-threonylcarbamoyltransferase complex ATPase subunit type 1 TsaE [Candidatus Liptonbacteria bacterium]|nr:tRNA (adenosine(37)-N6)-threonylcarbamoyltransferase complex ATPase subunit type 1 TsaE [Candidatus Liptonbacteria bacterium]
MTIYQSSSSGATKRFAKELAQKILSARGGSALGGKSKPGSRAAIVALVGELGAGKTTFAQGFASGVGIKGAPSPTFILMRNTELKGKTFKNFIHIDAYRATAADFLKLGFKEIAANPNNVILVEWADRLKKLMPKSAIWLKLEHGRKENERMIKI